MKFFALGYKYQEDVFYDFEKEEDSLSLEPTCFLPSRKIAEQLIENEVGDDYFIVEVELLSLNEKTGTYSTTINPGKGHWESYFDEED